MAAKGKAAERVVWVEVQAARYIKVPAEMATDTGRTWPPGRIGRMPASMAAGYAKDGYVKVFTTKTAADRRITERQNESARKLRGTGPRQVAKPPEVTVADLIEIAEQR